MVKPLSAFVFIRRKLGWVYEVVEFAGEEVLPVAMTDKKVKLTLVGVNGNAYAVMAAFSKQARKESWTKDEIDGVLEEAMSSDYNHLLVTIMNHCDDPDDDNDEEGDDDADG